MDKKDIYEHLAKIYLDASSKKKKRNKAYPKLFKNLFIVSIFLMAGLSTTLLSSAFKKQNLNSETALVLQNGHAKINFNFNPAKKESYTLELNRLNLARFKMLAFSVRSMGPKDKITLRVEFTNSFKEKSEIYLRGLPSNWQDFRINLSEFKNISDWSEIDSLSFCVEEWNVSGSKGLIFIDNVRLLKT
ncbi:MAG: hypothetical protein V1869_06535 [Candidatus Omnitrophota bacterium]